MVCCHSLTGVRWAPGRASLPYKSGARDPTHFLKRFIFGPKRKSRAGSAYERYRVRGRWPGSVKKVENAISRPCGAPKRPGMRARAGPCLAMPTRDPNAVRRAVFVQRRHLVGDLGATTARKMVYRAWHILPLLANAFSW